MISRPPYQPCSRKYEWPGTKFNASYIRLVEQELGEWLEQHEYDSVERRGSLYTSFMVNQNRARCFPDNFHCTAHIEEWGRKFRIIAARNNEISMNVAR